MTARTYSGSTDPAALVAEIIAAGLPQAPNPGSRFSGVVNDGLGVTVWIEDNLSPTEVGVLDGVVAAHTAARALAGAKTARTYRLAVAATGYIGAHYPEPSQRSLLALHLSTHASGLLNRRAYIQAAIDWVESVLQDYRVRSAEIAAAATPAEVAAIGWDFTPFDATDPLATVVGALAIPD